MRTFFLWFAVACLVACLAYTIAGRTNYAVLYGVLAIFNYITVKDMRRD